MGPIASQFWFTVRQTFFRRKIWPAIFLLAAPAGIALVIRQFADTPDPWERYHGPMQFALFAFAIPLICMLYGAELIGSEVESRTIVYWVTRRSRRHTVLLVRFLAVAGVLCLLFVVSALAVFASALGGLDLSHVRSASAPAGTWVPWNDLWQYILILPSATLAYLALFVLFGLAASKPLGLSVGYFIVIESIVANLPLVVRQYSIAHFVRKSMFGRIPGLFSLHDVPRDLRKALYPENGSGILMLVAIAAIAMIFACFLVSGRELVPAKLVRE